jgi:Xaa-Pro aminopeptidase
MDEPVVQKLRAEMKADGLNALVAHSPDNATYIAGFPLPSHAQKRFRRTITVLAGRDFRLPGRRKCRSVARSRKSGHLVPHDPLIEVTV